MRASGKLINKVVIYAPTVNKSASGASSPVWVKKYETRGALKNINYNRDIELDEVVYNSRRELVLRYYVPIDDFDRVEVDDKLYRVISIDKRFHDQEIVILIEAVNE